VDAQPEDRHLVADVEPRVVNSLERDGRGLDQHCPLGHDLFGQDEPVRGHRLRLTMRERQMNVIADSDPAYVVAHFGDPTHPLVAEAHRVELGLCRLHELAQVEIEALATERGAAAIEGKLGAVADSARNGVRSHRIRAEHDVVVRDNLQRPGRCEYELIWHYVEIPTPIGRRLVP